MAVYANERRGRFGPQEGGTIEEGAAVRDRQSILKLPDLSQMQVKVLVHETKVEEVRPGMRARINIQGRELQGTVVSIANQPEQADRWGSNIKQYATIVKIDGTPDGLKPGMTAEAEILIAHLKGVITLPVATVVEQRNEFFCWVRKPDGSIERRRLLLGLTNDLFVEVKDGVAEGDLVVQNPRAFVEEARSDGEEDETVDVEGRFGNGGADPGAAEGGDQPSANGGTPRGGGFGRGGRRGDGGEIEGGRGGRGGGRGGGRRGGRGFDLTQLDQDGDGKVSREEAPEPMQDFFSRLDGNGDGFIDQEEVSAMRANFGRGGGGPPNGAEE
jgi:HlyD family secretion protein